jgi:hypothetical protein
MAKDNDAFAADVQDLKDIYYYQIPSKGYLELKIKRDMLDQPVFRNSDISLDARTYTRWLGQIGTLIGLKQSLTYKIVHQIAIKILNSQSSRA